MLQRVDNMAIMRVVEGQSMATTDQRTRIEDVAASQAITRAGIINLRKQLRCFRRRLRKLAAERIQLLA
jgi:hypothetical protein